MHSCSRVQAPSTSSFVGQKHFFPYYIEVIVSSSFLVPHCTKGKWQKCVLCPLSFPAFWIEKRKKGLGGSCRMKTKTLLEFAYSHIGKRSLSLDDLLVVGPIDAVLLGFGGNLEFYIYFFIFCN